jgi:hypothetical protein
LIADAVTSLGAGVDGLVRKIGKTYAWNGAQESVSSYDASNAVVEETKYEYDNNQNLSKMYQSHSGSVNTAVTPYVGYTYAGIWDGHRTSAMKYPGGKTLTYGYNARQNLTTIADAGTTLATYVHSGGGSVMQTTYNQPGLSLTYAGGGMDRFGRVVNHAWMKNNAALVHIIHGYDYAGNRTHRHDAVHAANSELYAYDSMNQIKSLNRGTLNVGNTAVVTSNFTEAWDFDKTGNWLQYENYPHVPVWVDCVTLAHHVSSETHHP